MKNNATVFVDFTEPFGQIFTESKLESLLVSKFSVDPLVLSSLLYRLHKENVIEAKGCSITDSEKFADRVTLEDMKMATEIRTDFGKKLSYFSLTVGKLSKFKTVLDTYLKTDFRDEDGIYRVSSEYLGMIYKLPYFHEYNIDHQSLFDHINSRIKDEIHKGNMDLRFIKSLDSGRKKTEGKIEYWFENTKTNHRVLIQFDKKNQLLPLLNRLVENPMTVSGYFVKRSNYANEYWVARNWEIVLD